MPECTGIKAPGDVGTAADLNQKTVRIRPNAAKSSCRKNLMTETGYTIAVIADDAGLNRLICSALQRKGVPYLTFASGRDAVDTICQTPPQLIIIDYPLHDMSGSELIDLLAASGLEIPFIVISGRDDATLAVEMMKRGAREYLVKDTMLLDRLPAIIDRTMEELGTRQRLRQAEIAIQQLTNYDSLTGLPNRMLLEDRLNQAIARAHREEYCLGVMFLDLDQFKQVNDTLGHTYGDYLLKLVSRRLEHCLRKSDTVARLGGDDFIIILTGVRHCEHISQVARKILDVLSEPLQLDEHEIFTTASIGIAIYPVDGDAPHLLLKNADIAMYQAKEQGRNAFQFFSREMNYKAEERLLLDNSLRRALERQEFFVLYQPQMNLLTGELIGMEALVRWQHPEMGLVTPDKFIPLAEDSGLIIPIGEWVLKTACRQNKAWHDMGFGPLRVAVNLSGRQFKQERLVESVATILNETGLAPSLLELEITESIIMRNAEETIVTLRRLKEMGISLAIDDFGTGYSSLSYLKHFPIDRLKIDRSFVLDITNDPDDAAIAEAIISMAHSLKLKVTAEGVEQQEQLLFLAQRNCDEMQGYLVSRPISAEEFTILLQQGISLPQK